MKEVAVPSDAVLVVMVRARPQGPRIDFTFSSEWWEAASMDRKANIIRETVLGVNAIWQKVQRGEDLSEFRKELFD